jgi:hypothetical protein
MSFTAKYLSILGNVIYDDKGIEIPTIKVKKDSNFFFEYRKPVVEYDKLSIGKTLNEPVISEISRMELNRYGFCIISVKGGWRRGQSKIYKICRNGRIPANGILVPGRPMKHKIEIDRANNCLRLVGKNAGITGMGGWIFINED